MIKAELLDKAPVGIIGVANKSGWINEMIFVQMTTSLQMSLATEQFCFYNSNLKCAFMDRLKIHYCCCINIVK